MPQFLSPEWVAAFDHAVAGVTLPPLGDDAGLVASTGKFSVAQLVRGGPDGDVTVVLTVDDGTLHLALADDQPPEGEVEANVTVVVSYDDAIALASGTLSAAQAITAGRIRVRGDLAVLSAGQAMLIAAQPHTAGLQATTTY